MGLVAVHPTWRRALFVVVGALLSYLVIGTAVGIYLGIVVFHELPSATNGQVQFWVNGLVLLTSLIAGGAVGSRLGSKPGQLESEASEAIRNDRTTTSHFAAHTSGPTSPRDDYRNELRSDRVPGRYDWDGRTWSIAPMIAEKRKRTGLTLSVVLGHVMLAAGATMAGYAVGAYSSPNYDFLTETWYENDDFWIIGIVSGGVVAFAGVLFLLVAAFARRSRSAAEPRTRAVPPSMKVAN